ncbi:MAG: DUF1266 domain-containing protein [Polyangiaceae bacterium]
MSRDLYFPPPRLPPERATALNLLAPLSLRCGLSPAILQGAPPVGAATARWVLGHYMGCHDEQDVRQCLSEPRALEPSWQRLQQAVQRGASEAELETLAGASTVGPGLPSSSPWMVTASARVAIATRLASVPSIASYDLACSMMVARYAAAAGLLDDEEAWAQIVAGAERIRVAHEDYVDFGEALYAGLCFDQGDEDPELDDAIHDCLQQTDGHRAWSAPWPHRALVFQLGDGPATRRPRPPGLDAAQAFVLAVAAPSVEIQGFDHAWPWLGAPGTGVEAKIAAMLFSGYAVASGEALVALIKQLAASGEAFDISRAAVMLRGGVTLGLLNEASCWSALSQLATRVFAFGSWDAYLDDYLRAARARGGPGWTADADPTSNQAKLERLRRAPWSPFVKVPWPAVAPVAGPSPGTVVNAYCRYGAPPGLTLLQEVATMAAVVEPMTEGLWPQWLWGGPIGSGVSVTAYAYLSAEGILTPDAARDELTNPGPGYGPIYAELLRVLADNDGLPAQPADYLAPADRTDDEIARFTAQLEIAFEWKPLVRDVSAYDTLRIILVARSAAAVGFVDESFAAGHMERAAQRLLRTYGAIADVGRAYVCGKELDLGHESSSHRDQLDDVLHPSSPWQDFDWPRLSR